MMSGFPFHIGRIRIALISRLQGVNGFTGHGDIAFLFWRSGAKKFDIGLSGVAGRSADVFIDDAHYQAMPLDNGAARFTVTTSRGDSVPDLAPGAKFEIRQNGEAILGGTLNAKPPVGLFQLPQKMAAYVRSRAR
jgi:hypothetical protein